MDRIDYLLIGLALFLALFTISAAARAYELHRLSQLQIAREAAFLAEFVQ